jgi:hypothetical protein
MTTINSTELPASEPEMPDGEPETQAARPQAPRPQGRVSRGVLAATVAVVAGITGGVVWLLAGTGGDDPQQPVQVIQDDGTTSGQQYGSADSLEHQANSGQQYGSADSLEHQAGTPAQ